MRTIAPISIPAVLALIVMLAGCESKTANLDEAKSGTWAGRSLSYETAFSAAFENGQWAETKDESGKKVVRFTGTISAGLHGYALEKITASGEKAIFSAACEYLAATLWEGKASTDSSAAFNPANYPLRNGYFIPAQVGPYLAKPENKPHITALVDHYVGKYWEPSSTVVFQWEMTKIGKFDEDKPAGALQMSPRLESISNPFLDMDPQFKGNPGAVMTIVFEYAGKAKNGGSVAQPDSGKSL